MMFKYDFFCSWTILGILFDCLALIRVCNGVISSWVSYSDFLVGIYGTIHTHISGHYHQMETEMSEEGMGVDYYKSLWFLFTTPDFSKVFSLSYILLNMVSLYFILIGYMF